MKTRNEANYIAMAHTKQFKNSTILHMRKKTQKGTKHMTFVPVNYEHLLMPLSHAAIHNMCSYPLK